MESKWFTEDDFKCHCCGALPPNGIDQNLVNMLDDMRDAAGKSLSLNCGYRCATHNAEVGGVPGSQHNADPCTAADVDATTVGVEALAQIAEKANADGVGRYFGDMFVHVDCRSGRIGDTFRWNG